MRGLPLTCSRGHALGQLLRLLGVHSPGPALPTGPHFGTWSPPQVQHPLSPACLRPAAGRGDSRGRPHLPSLRVYPGSQAGLGLAGPHQPGQGPQAGLRGSLSLAWLPAPISQLCHRSGAGPVRVRGQSSVPPPLGPSRSRSAIWRDSGWLRAARWGTLKMPLCPPAGGCPRPSRRGPGAALGSCGGVMLDHPGLGCSRLFGHVMPAEGGGGRGWCQAVARQAAAKVMWNS